MSKTSALNLIDERAENYARQFSSQVSPLANRVEAETRAAHPKAHMLSGALLGRFLQMTGQLLKPHRILEIGTFTGYSALCLAEALEPDGQLHTLELREAEADKAQYYFNQSPRKEQIILHRGNALEIIPSLAITWDLVYIDADKVHYIDYYELVLPRLRRGGIILADNVLFHGEVLTEPVKGKNALAIHAFNQHVQRDPQVELVMLTLRDGLMLIRKK